MANSTPPASAERTTLLDPASLHKLGGLEIIARHIVEGFLQGLHRSAHIGFATDFAHHRPYAPGDDVRRIDWRAFARSERFYLKQHEVSTILRAHILLDASASMAYQGDADAVSKFRYAQFLAASLAYLILRQRDSVGLTPCDNAIGDGIAPRSAPSQLARVLTMIEATTPRNASGLVRVLQETAARIHGRGMIILISDMLDDAGGIANALHQLRHAGHEVLLLHVMSPDELSFPFGGWTTFEDVEHPAHHSRVDPAVMRSTYLANLDHHLRVLRNAAHKLEIPYALIDTSQALDVALSKLTTGATDRQ